MTATAALTRLASDLESAAAGRSGTLEFTRAARAAMAPGGALARALTPRHGAVLDDLLARLESGGMAAAESCSFSQTDLFDALAGWCEHARIHLEHRAARQDAPRSR
jgi:uncharacterized protein with von Willebrand factor type A (vWA) domain